MKKLLIFLALSLLSVGVLANTMTPPGGDTHWVYYSYGNAKAVGAFFEALTRIVDTASFKSLLVALAIGGFAASGAAGMISGSPTKFFGYIIGMMLLVYSIFGLNANVYVKEMVYAEGSAGEFVIVEKVPAAIAIPMVVISKVGSGITDLFNQHLTTPQGHDLIEQGGSLPFGAGMGIAKDMADVRISNPYLSKNFNEWVAKCLAPRVFSGEVNMADVASSTDLLDTLSKTKAAKSNTQLFKMTHLDGSIGSATTHDSGDLINKNSGFVTCHEGFGILESQLESEVKGSMVEIGKKISPMLAGEILSADEVGAIATNVAGSSVGTATNLATQGAIISLMEGSSAYQAQVLDNDPALLALNLNNAQRSQKTGWYTASVLFRDMGGYFFAILQVFLIGVTPLILALMFIPGMGAKLGGSYIKACIWLASWWPSLQIVNFVMEIYYQSAATTTFGAGGLTMVNQGLANQFSDNMIIAAGFMATLVPTVMWGIINGAGYALTSVLDRAAGANYASSAAQDSSAGNFRAGNVGMNSFSANKFDNSIAYTTGTRAAEAFNGVSSMSSVEELGGRGATANNAAVSKQYSESAQKKLTEAKMNEEAAATAFNSQLSATTKETVSNLNSLVDSSGTVENGQVTFSNREDFDSAVQMMGALKESYNHAVSNGYSHDFKTYASTALGGNVGPTAKGWSGGISLKGELGAKIERTDSDSVKFTETEDGSITLTDSQGHKIVNNKTLQSMESGNVSMTGISTQSYAQTKDAAELAARSEDYKTARKNTLAAEAAVTKSETTTIANATDGSVYTAAVFTQGEADISGAKDDVSARSGELERKVDQDGTKEKVETQLEEPLQIKGKDGDPIDKNTIADEVDETKEKADEIIGDADKKTKESFEESRLENLRNQLDPINDGNKGVVSGFLLHHETAMADITGKSARDFNQGGEGAEILSRADNFAVDGQVFELSGLVANKNSEDGYDLTYRTGSNANDYKYYAVNDNGEMRHLRVEQEGEGNYYGGYQVDSLSDYTERTGEASQHQGDRKGGTEFDNINPENMGNKPYKTVDASGVGGLGGTDGSHTASELAANSDTGIDRANEPMAGVMSVSEAEHMRNYDYDIDEASKEGSHSFAKFQQSRSADWSGDSPSANDIAPATSSPNVVDITLEPAAQAEPQTEPQAEPQAEPQTDQPAQTEPQAEPQTDQPAQAEPQAEPQTEPQEPQLNAAGNVAGTFHPPRNEDPNGSTSVDIPANFSSATTVLPVVNDYFQSEHGRDATAAEWQQAKYEIGLANPEMNRQTTSRTVEVSNELLSGIANKED